MDTIWTPSPKRRPVYQITPQRKPFILLIPGGGIEPARGYAPRDFKGKNRGWRKHLETHQKLRQPLNFTKEIDND
jgi:hypothetical protein